MIVVLCVGVALGLLALGLVALGTLASRVTLAVQQADCKAQQPVANGPVRSLASLDLHLDRVFMANGYPTYFPSRSVPGTGALSLAQVASLSHDRSAARVELECAGYRRGFGWAWTLLPSLDTTSVRAFQLGSSAAAARLATSQIAAFGRLAGAPLRLMPGLSAVGAVSTRVDKAHQHREFIVGQDSDVMFLIDATIPSQAMSSDVAHIADLVDSRVRVVESSAPGPPDDASSAGPPPPPGTPAPGPSQWTADRASASGTGENLVERSITTSSLPLLRVTWTTDLRPWACSAPAPVVIAQGALYSVWGGVLSSFDLATGRARWSSTLPTPGGCSPGIAYGDGRVYVVGDPHTGHLAAFDATSGAQVWSLDTGSETARPVFDDGMVLFGLATGRVSAVDAASGRVRWTCQLANSAATVSVSDGVVVVAQPSQLGITALDEATGEMRWSVLSGSRVPPAIAGGTVYVTTEYQEVEALDASTGATKWAANVNAAQPVAISGDLVVATTADARIVAIDRRSGRVLWRRIVDAGAAPPSSADGIIFIAAGYGSNARTTAFDGSGAMLWRGPGGSGGATAIIADGAVILRGDTRVDVLEGVAANR